MDNEITKRLKGKKNGSYCLNLSNVYLVLSSHTDWAGVFMLDECNDGVVYKQKPPYDRAHTGPLNESDYRRIKLFISSCLGGTPATSTIHDAVLLVAEDSTHELPISLGEE